MWREVARFEARLQGREFLTGIYIAVFFFLTFGYTSSGVVELVTGRGEVARNAPWALAHAMAGVTAFGQVITTMITATAVMRDVATRQQELLFSTRLTTRDYLLGRWAGALVVMLVVYTAIPVGLLTGTMMPWVEAGTLLPFSGSAYVRPLLLLVLPNVLLVSALFFTVGALGRSFMTILLLGVGLVALWSSGVALARDGVVWGTLLDPFGNAALEWVTRGWSALDRAQTMIPVDGILLMNRALWLGIGAAALAALARVYRFEVAGAPRGQRDERSAAPHMSASPGPENSAPASQPASEAVARAECVWIVRWTLRERGFFTLATLGALNALLNAWRAGGADPTAGDVLAAVQEHARLFLILVATIYAGELVWRERDVRTDAMRDALPGATGALVAGKVAGILLAQLVLVIPLLLVALGAGWGRGATGMSLQLAVAWIGGLVYPFVAQLTLLSLLVHAVVQQKVAGHVLLIAGWVTAVAMERTLQVAPWLRFANLPAFSWSPVGGFGGQGAALGWWTAYWSAAAAACAVLASVWWVRGVQQPFGRRLGGALRLLAGPHGVVLAAVLALAAAAAWRAMAG